jgi:thioredoxin 1
MKPIYTLNELESAIATHPMVVVYFSSETCNVCKTLKPKMVELLNARFPGVALYYVDIEKSPVISGQYRVFSIPTIDIYVEGREHARFSRNLTLFDFEKSLHKPYEILFGG